MSTMALDVFAVGIAPSCVTQKPKYSIYDWPKEEFSMLYFSPFYCNFITNCSDLVK